MASRFYLEATGAASVTPGFSAGWENTASFDRVVFDTTKAGTTMTSITVAHDGTNNDDVGRRQYISNPMAAGVVFTSGNALKCQIRCRETSSTNNYQLCVGVRVVTQDGTTTQATLKTVAPAGTEFSSTALTNRKLSTTLGAGYTTVAGDRLVVEIGIRAVGASAQTDNATFSVGSDSGTDLPEDETTTTANNPWVEFQDNVTFLSGGGQAGTSTALRPTRRRRR